jgi:hypothetical protein
MEFAGFRFRFSALDFGQRVEAAASRLGFVGRCSLDAGELADLVALAAHGDIPEPASPLADHVAEHRERILGWDDDLVYWLRKLVFRGAWLDQQVKDGQLEPVFGERDGFSYRSATTEKPVVEGSRAPDWSSVAYRAA